MLALRLVITSLALFLCCVVHASESYTVSYVYDGDTVQISTLQLADSQGQFKLRLSDIDAPERNQPYGLKARRALMKLCQGTDVEVRVEISGTDKYARKLGILNCNGTDASLYLVEHGYAWHSAKFSNNPQLKQAAAKARENKRGLWQDPDPMPPWLWRKRNLQP